MNQGRTVTSRQFLSIAMLITPLCAAAAAGAEGFSSEPLDIGLFARVAASDPARRDGAKSGRLDEFRAEDVFLSTELVPDASGRFCVPAAAGQKGAIGLEWAERRVIRELHLEFFDGSQVPPAEQVEVQFWSSAGREDSWGEIGQTPWQGIWEKLPGKVERRGQQLVLSIPEAEVPEFRKSMGVFKVRWLLPPRGKDYGVRRPAAFSDSQWTTGEFRFEAAENAPGKKFTLRAYNGQILAPDTHQPVEAFAWDADRPLLLKVRHCEPSRRKADRTLVRIECGQDQFSVALEDVLAGGELYAKDFGIYVARGDNKRTLAEYERHISGQKTVLQRVHALPDQTLQQAMDAIWRPIQNNGPTMLSLACDNMKFIVDRDGAIHHEPLRMSVRFGAGCAEVKRMDFGLIGLNTTVRPNAASPGLPLRIAGQTFSKGIGLHANAEIVVPLNGRYKSFETLAGVFPCGQPGGTATLQVDVDGQRRFDSGVMRQGEPARQVSVSLESAGEMVLRVSEADGGILNDAVNLADARFIRVDAAGSSGAVELGELLSARKPEMQRRIERPDLPILWNSTEIAGLVCTQRTFVAPTDDSQPTTEAGRQRAVCVAEFTVENRTQTPQSADAVLGFGPEKADGKSISLEATGGKVFVRQSDRLLASVSTRDESLSLSCRNGGVQISGRIEPKSAARWVVLIPAGETPLDAGLLSADPAVLRDRVARHWEYWLRGGMRIEVPDQLVADVFRATQIHCLLVARNQDQGRLVEPWIAAAAYGPLDTEAQAVILGMDLAGYDDFARRSHDFFLASYDETGKLAKGYTLMGTGQNLWTLAEHYSLTRDKEWLQRAAPTLVRACRWIARQAGKTKRLDPGGQMLPEYGLAPPGVLADWNRYAYYFYANAHYCAGLEATARALADINHADAEEIRKCAADYRASLLRAWRWQQARMPVVPLSNGTWVQPCPSSLYSFGLTRDFYGGVSSIGHDVEAGGNHIIPLGLVDPGSRDAESIVNYLEDRWFLIDGIFDAYPARENEADWFNRGGFSKLQPHYTRTSDIHALRDDVKAFVRTYFNTFPVLLNRENLSYWEHMNNGGAWNKTHESGWFLEMTRTMFVTQRDQELWLAPFVTNNWLKDGMTVSVRGAPTRFGPVSYCIRSSASRGLIEATIEPPLRDAPKCIVLRVRHPAGSPMRQVRVDGQQHAEFDAASDTIRIPPKSTAVKVEVQY